MIHDVKWQIIVASVFYLDAMKSKVFGNLIPTWLKKNKLANFDFLNF